MGDRPGQSQVPPTPLSLLCHLPLLPLPMSPSPVLHPPLSSPSIIAALISTCVFGGRGAPLFSLFVSLPILSAPSSLFSLLLAQCFHSDLSTHLSLCPPPCLVSFHLPPLSPSLSALPLPLLSGPVFVLALFPVSPPSGTFPASVPPSRSPSQRLPQSPSTLTPSALALGSPPWIPSRS